MSEVGLEAKVQMRLDELRKERERMVKELEEQARVILGPINAAIGELERLLVDSKQESAGSEEE